MKSDDSTDKSFKGYSKYRARQLSFPPPTLNTQLPFKLEEEENDEDDSSNKSSTDANSFEVIKWDARCLSAPNPNFDLTCRNS